MVQLSQKAPSHTTESARRASRGPDTVALHDATKLQPQKRVHTRTRARKHEEPKFGKSTRDSRDWPSHSLIGSFPFQLHTPVTPQRDKRTPLCTHAFPLRSHAVMNSHQAPFESEKWSKSFKSDEQLRSNSNLAKSCSPVGVSRWDYCAPPQSRRSLIFLCNVSTLYLLLESPQYRQYFSLFAVETPDTEKPEVTSS